MQQPVWKIKPFHQLNIFELYGILRLRQEVFAVEQNCVYLDLDGKDQFCDHLFAVDDNGRVTACARIVQPGTAYHEVSIGRVASHPDLRGTGLGRQIMEKSIAFVEDKYGQVDIRIEAQFYLEKFYTEFGFASEGKVYLLDGIEHIEMLRHRTPVKV